MQTMTDAPECGQPETCTGTQFDVKAEHALIELWHHDNSVFNDLMCDGIVQDATPYQSFESKNVPFMKRGNNGYQT